MEWLLALVIGVLLGFIMDQIVAGIAIAFGLLLTYQALRMYFSNRKRKH